MSEKNETPTPATIPLNSEVKKAKKKPEKRPNIPVFGTEEEMRKFTPPEGYRACSLTFDGKEYFTYSTDKGWAIINFFDKTYGVFAWVDAKPTTPGTVESGFAKLSKEEQQKLLEKLLKVTEGLAPPTPEPEPKKGKKK